MPTGSPPPHAPTEEQEGQHPLQDAEGFQLLAQDHLLWLTCGRIQNGPPVLEQPRLAGRGSIRARVSVAPLAVQSPPAPSAQLQGKGERTYSWGGERHPPARPCGSTSSSQLQLNFGLQAGRRAGAASG